MHYSQEHHRALLHGDVAGSNQPGPGWSRSAAEYCVAIARANIERTYRAYEALQADDIETFLTYVDRDVEWHSLILEIEGVFRGHDGVREWWNGLRVVFPDWNPSIVEAREFGDRVVIHGRATGSGAASGVGIDDDFWQVAEFQGGRIVWYRAVRTEREALEAAGLSE